MDSQPMNMAGKLGKLAHGGESLEPIENVIERKLREGVSKVQIRRELDLPDFTMIDAIDHMIHAPSDAE